MPLLVTTLPLAAIMMAVAATLVREGQGYFEAPTWSGTAAVVLLIYSLLIVPYLLAAVKWAITCVRSEWSREHSSAFREW